MEMRNITYYKTTKPIIFNDGFEIPVGTKVQFNFAEGQVYNVQFKKYNEKRIFWIHNSDLELFKTVKEKWLKKEIEEHNIDLNDKWFEYEKQRISESKNKKRNSTSSIKDTDRKKSKQPKEHTTGVSRTARKAGVPVKTRKKATAEKKSKGTTRKIK
jgi:hypothetical protein